jgi:hypothetical protein
MQFTGFYDRSGRKIFAGDVFRALRAQRLGRTIIGYEETRLEVVYDPETGSFNVGNNTVGWRPLSEVTSMYEVIGDKSESPAPPS